APRGSPSNGRPHNPCREAMQERVVRQIRMLRAMWRELETGLRTLLIGHEGGNLGHSQGATYGFTAPVPDPTRPTAGPARGKGPPRPLRGLDQHPPNGASGSLL